MAFIKIEVVENEGYNSVVLTPRDDDDETRKQLDLAFHAIMTSQPKRVATTIGSNSIRVDVKKADLLETFNETI